MPREPDFCHTFIYCLSADLPSELCVFVAVIDAFLVACDVDCGQLHAWCSGAILVPPKPERPSRSLQPEIITADMPVETGRSEYFSKRRSNDRVTSKENSKRLTLKWRSGTLVNWLVFYCITLFIQRADVRQHFVALSLTVLELQQNWKIKVQQPNVPCRSKAYAKNDVLEKLHSEILTVWPWKLKIIDDLTAVLWPQANCWLENACCKITILSRPTAVVAVVKTANF